MKKIGLMIVGFLVVLVPLVMFGPGVRGEEFEYEEGCDALPRYQAYLQESILEEFQEEGIEDEAIDLLSNLGGDKVLGFTEEEWGELGAALDVMVEGLENVDPPEIAEEWHELVIQSMRLVANMAHEAEGSGVLIAAMIYGEAAEEAIEEADREESVIQSECGPSWFEDGIFGSMDERTPVG
jgi:hypothetical protein